MELWRNWYGQNGVNDAYQALNQARANLKKRIQGAKTQRNIEQIEKELNELFYSNDTIYTMSKVLQDTFDFLGNKIMEKAPDMPTILATTKDATVYSGNISESDITITQKSVQIQTFQNLISRVEEAMKKISSSQNINILRDSVEYAGELKALCEQNLNNWLETMGSSKTTKNQNLISLYAHLKAVEKYLKGGGLNKTDYGNIAEYAVALYFAGAQKIVDQGKKQVNKEILNTVKKMQQGQLRAKRAGSLPWQLDITSIKGQLVEEKGENSKAIKKVLDLGNGVRITIQENINNLNSVVDVKADVMVDENEMGISVKNWTQFGFWDYRKQQAALSGLNETKLLGAISRSTQLEEKYGWALQSDSKRLLDVAHQMARLSILIDIAMGNFTKQSHNANILIINNHEEHRFYVIDIVQEIMNAIDLNNETSLFRIGGYEPNKLESTAEMIQEFALSQEAGHRSSIYTTVILNYLNSITVGVKFNMLSKSLQK